MFWLQSRSLRHAAVLGFAFGIGKFGVGVSWVYVSMRLYGGASMPLAAFLVALFVAGLAVFTLLQGWLYGRVAGGRAALPDAVLFAAVWVLFEWLLTWFLTGFPWLYPGYAHLETPLLDLIPVGGVSLASLGIVLTSVFLVAALTGRGRVPALVLAALPWLAGYGLSHLDWVRPGSAHSVALVQGNVDQSMKWQSENRVPIVERYLEMTEPYWGSDLIVWPEAAITLFEHQAQGVLDVLDERGEQSGTTLLLGIPTAERTTSGDWLIYNSALATGAGSGRYSKRRLVPFGDYVPFEDLLRGLIRFFDLPMSAFRPGARHQASLDAGVGQAAMGICYEIAYGDLMRRSAQGADVLVTISNDTWFGSSIGPLQHMQMARARAVGERPLAAQGHQQRSDRDRRSPRQDDRFASPVRTRRTDRRVPRHERKHPLRPARRRLAGRVVLRRLDCRIGLARTRRLKRDRIRSGFGAQGRNAK